MAVGLFGELLKASRESKGLSGYRVSAEAGIDRGLYAKIETGQRQPTDDVLTKLAPVLEIPLDELRAWAEADRIQEQRVAKMAARTLEGRPLDIKGRLEELERDLAQDLHAQYQIVEGALPGILTPENAEKLTELFLQENLKKILESALISQEGIQKIDMRELVGSVFCKKTSQNLGLAAEEVARKIRVHFEEQGRQ